MEYSSQRRRNYFLISHRKDNFIEFIRGLLEHSFVLNSMESTVPDSWLHVEKLVLELYEAQVRNDGSAAKTSLKQNIPEIGMFHTPLPLQDAYIQYDNKYCISKRRFVKPSFNDIRHILNLAQINELAGSLKLMTLDGDCTLYSNGDNFNDMSLARYIGTLLMNGVTVALVTAAGYGLDASKYEFRIGMLLESFTINDLTKEAKERFFVIGGECNYLLQCGEDSHLHPIDETIWTGKTLHGWPLDQVTNLLDISEQVLKTAQQDLKLQVRLIRKERAVGMIPGGKSAAEKMPQGSGHKTISRELLDECVLRVHDAVRQSDVTIPFCAFNGGNDVWIDVGNKKVGVRGLQTYLKVSEKESIHVGDQFSKTGNDFAARSCSTCAWIISPEETKYLMAQLIEKSKWEMVRPKSDLGLSGSLSSTSFDSPSPTRRGIY